MDISLRGLITNWLPNVPHLMKTIIQAPFGSSPNAEYQDCLTEIIVETVRPILRTPAALLKSQQFFNLDTGIWGSMWVIKCTIPAPADVPQDGELKHNVDGEDAAMDIPQTMTFAIDILATHEDENSCPIPGMNAEGVEAEWTSYRQQARPWSTTPSGLSDQDIYGRMLTDLAKGPDSAVILFAHGGAFCLMDPANHRHFAARLAGNTNSRVLNVRYRLSPQSIFPAALMDIYLAYLSLLSPPPGSLHQPVPGHKIVLAGDSSGGNLVTALQTLISTLVLHGKTKIRNPWYQTGADEFITIPNPPTAALSLASPWLDITRSLPSCTQNSKYDFIAPPEPLEPSLMSTSPMFPPDEIWPAKPVRTETYCEAVMCAHPLVSPLTAPLEVLRLFPAVYACTGWEGMTDETEVFMRRLAEAKTQHPENMTASETDSNTTLSTQPASLQWFDGEIVFDGYIGMPHTFAVIPYNQAGSQAGKNRAEHIKKAVSDLTSLLPGKEQSTVIGSGPRKIGRASWTNVKTMKETAILIADLGMTSEFSGYTRVQPLTDEFMFTKVEEGRSFRVELERRLREGDKAVASRKNV